MMIKTSRQLKDLTRNLSKGNSGKAQFLLRNYAMERFLERMSVSRHKDNFILKSLWRTKFVSRSKALQTSYADSITWDAAVSSVRLLCDSCIHKHNEDDKK